MNIIIGRKRYVNFTSYALVKFIIGKNTWHAQLVFVIYSSTKFRPLEFLPIHSLHALSSLFFGGGGGGGGVLQFRPPPPPPKIDLDQ